MDHVYSTTTKHEKGKHFSYYDRVLIQIRLKDGWSANKIAKEIGCAPNTVRNEIRRGTVSLYRGNVKRYKAKVGQATYQQNRLACGRHLDNLEKAAFLAYVDSYIKEDKWSLDACVERALQSGEFVRCELVCTKILYRYVDLGLIDTRNHNLPEKLKRNTKAHRIRKNKKKLGRSIEERPKEVENRQEFGYWEADLVVGQKSGNDQVLLTLVERKSREYWMLPIKNRHAYSVMEAFHVLQKTYSEHFSQVFKTITTDNVSEFSRLSELEELSETLVFYTHPYTSCEKGTNERHNGIIRRFIPKGKRISYFDVDYIADIEIWCNSLPRKILNYRTPDEVFEDELDLIYRQTAS